MKKFGSNLIYGKNAKISMVLALAALALVVLGCGGGKSTDKPVTSDFYGSWSASDGSTLRITSDGTAFYKSGGTSVDNGAAKLDETGKTLKLSLLGVTIKELKIDQPPKNGTMKLDGVVYQTADSGEKGTPSPEETSTISDDPDMPSSSEMNEMVKTTILDFNDAIQQEDFTDFRNNVSKDFKAQFTADKMKEAFDQFIKNKSQANPIFTSVSSKTPSYSPAPNITKEKGHKLLNIKGTYDTTDVTAFDLQYILEDSDWKLLKIKVRVG
jgi:hypothetical protein